MQYEARKFSQTSYNANDDWAKQQFIPYLEKKNYTIVSSEEDYSHDLKTISPEGKEVLFELEVKIGYPFKSSKSFPFDSVSFTGRKERLHLDKEFHYVIICKETKWAVTATSDKIYKKDYIEEISIDMSTRRGTDKFFRVPKEQCKFFNLNK